MIYIDKDSCISCGQCLEVCPQEAIKIESKGGKAYGVSYIDHDLCVQCGTCLEGVDCPGEAIRIQ